MLVGLLLRCCCAVKVFVGWVVVLFVVGCSVGCEVVFWVLTCWWLGLLKDYG